MNVNKQYRISKTEEKIISLLRDENTISSIKKLNDEKLSMIIKLLNGEENVDNINARYSRWKNLSLIRRLKKEEYNALIYIRVYKNSIFSDLDYESFASDNYLVRLYNLITNGVSKTLEDLLSSGFLNKECYDFIKSTDKSLVISGDLNTGKVTLLNAIIHDLDSKGERVLVLDDNSELQVSASDTITVCTSSNLLLNTLLENKDAVLVISFTKKELLNFLISVNYCKRIILLSPSGINNDLFGYSSVIKTCIKNDKKCVEGVY